MMLMGGFNKEPNFDFLKTADRSKIHLRQELTQIRFASLNFSNLSWFKVAEDNIFFITHIN